MIYQQRKNFFRVNRFQWPLVLVGLIPTLFFCAFSTFFVVYLHGALINFIRYHSTVRTVELINHWGLAVLISIWVFFALVYFWIQSISSHSVGAFERLLRELDHAIQTNDFSKKLRARNRDVLANELLKRINLLFTKLHKPKTGGDPSKVKGRF